MDFKDLKQENKDMSGDDYLLFLAASHGDINTCKELINKGCKADADQSRALCTAAASGYINICKLLIDNGADPNARNGLPLTKAVLYRNYDVCKLLFDNGAVVNDTNNKLFDDKTMNIINQCK